MKKMNNKCCAVFLSAALVFLLGVMVSAAGDAAADKLIFIAGIDGIASKLDKDGKLVSLNQYVAFVDGAAALAFEGEDVSVFALVHKNDVKEIRKNLKDSLQYVEAYIRTGYIGTVNGVSIYTSNEATEGSPILATKKAVTYFSKKGTEVEQDRESNIRKNTVYSRKYGIFAFTDATQAVRLKKGV